MESLWSCDNQPTLGGKMRPSPKDDRYFILLLWKTVQVVVCRFFLWVKDNIIETKLIIEYEKEKSSPGGTRMARGGIRLVHGLTKSTLITYFIGMKIDPKYTFLHAFFLICLSCSFQNLFIWTKTHPFFLFCMFLHP